ncbi:hypothetical protein BDM02DRAFT_3132628 [Thelephora ganbajun]|uniref:Uncharacterized protein n=1 Tax=Thelephora ganbajun TaxID=370292 RepID=A0ACB6Z172_THEGA|nr:hypothetical protein BDM02DRAFT_3132628 [Thelephora ganbajun]
MTPLANAQLLIEPPEKAKSIIQSNKAMTQAKSVKAGLIPKPPGRCSHNYVLFDEMQGKGENTLVVTRDTYNNLIRQQYIHKAVHASNIDMDLPFGDQEMAELVRVIACVKEEYPFIEKYANTWPMAAGEEAPNDTSEDTAGPSIATPGPDLNNDSNQDGDQSDVFLSDIDDD